MQCSSCSSRKSSILLITILSLLTSGVLQPMIISSAAPFPNHDASQADSQDLTVTSMPLRVSDSSILSASPSDFPINVTYGEGFFDGYNLFAIVTYNRTDGSKANSCLIITDMNGNIIMEKPNVFHALPVRFINSTTVMYTEAYPIQRTCLWNIYENITQYLDFTGHHESEYNPLSNTVFTFKGYTKNITGILYRYDKIQEYDLDGNLVWSLDTSLFIPTDWWCPYSDYYTGGKIDITHSNSIFFDPDEDVLYYHARNVNTFFKINHSSSKVIWGLGEHGNFTLFDAAGNMQEHLFFHAHAVELVDDNTFILFDNDYHNQTKLDNYGSRILEITIDQTTMTANESWSWTSSSAYFCAYWGDADRLPNGNRFGVFGATKHPGSPEIGARLVEVNGAGEIVWEMNFPSSTEYRYGVYSAERVRFNPILDSPSDILLRRERPRMSLGICGITSDPRGRLKVNTSFILMKLKLRMEACSLTNSGDL